MAEYGTTFPVTIPSLSEDANIVTAFEDYHDDIETYFGTLSTAIAGKQNTISGAASSITSTNLTTSRALASDAGGKVAVSIVTATELSYLSGVTSAIQTQLTAKANTADPTFTGTVTLPSTTSIGNVSSTELSYLDGVTSAIQTQLGTKVEKTNGTVTTADTSLNVVRNIRLSTDEPSGGSDGDVWLQYQA